MSVVLDEAIRKEVLPRFPVGSDGMLAPLQGGLINQTYLLTNDEERLVLQRVNPVFPAAIHENIHAITSALARAGMVTPMLVSTRDGRHCLELPPSAGDAAGVWRLMTYVGGTSRDMVEETAQASAAGALVARFHAALENLEHPFSGLRASVHDTPRHLQVLRDALVKHRNHRLFPVVSLLAEAILRRAQHLPALPTLPPQICHGDLKFNNVLFAGDTPSLRRQAVCLVDLDTVGPMSLAFEMGDAWRSWCNRNGENHEEAALDLDFFEASLDGYRAGRGRSLTVDERWALVLGPEWISLELAARFAADALTESYFGWDNQRFGTRGEHNLVRAKGQFSLHDAFGNSRALRTRLLDAAAR